MKVRSLNIVILPSSSGVKFEYRVQEGAPLLTTLQNLIYSASFGKDDGGSGGSLRIAAKGDVINLPLFDVRLSDCTLDGASFGSGEAALAALNPALGANFSSGGGGGEGQPTQITSTSLTIGGAAFNRTVELPTWTSNTSYPAGKLAVYDNKLYKAKQTTTAASWVAAEWQLIGGGGSGNGWSYTSHLNEGYFFIFCKGDVHNDYDIAILNLANADSTVSVVSGTYYPASGSPDGEWADQTVYQVTVNNLREDSVEPFVVVKGSQTAGQPAVINKIIQRVYISRTTLLFFEYEFMMFTAASCAIIFKEYYGYGQQYDAYICHADLNSFNFIVDRKLDYMNGALLGLSATLGAFLATGSIPASGNLIVFTPKDYVVPATGIPLTEVKMQPIAREEQSANRIVRWQDWVINSQHYAEFMTRYAYRTYSEYLQVPQEMLCVEIGAQNAIDFDVNTALSSDMFENFSGMGLYNGYTNVTDPHPVLESSPAPLTGATNMWVNSLNEYVGFRQGANVCIFHGITNIASGANVIFTIQDNEGNEVSYPLVAAAGDYELTDSEGLAKLGIMDSSYRLHLDNGGTFNTASDFMITETGIFTDLQFRPRSINPRLTYSTRLVDAAYATLPTNTWESVQIEREQVASCKVYIPGFSQISDIDWQYIPPQAIIGIFSNAQNNTQKWVGDFVVTGFSGTVGRTLRALRLASPAGLSAAIFATQAEAQADVTAGNHDIAFYPA